MPNDPFDEVHDCTFDWRGLRSTTPAMTRGDERPCDEYHGYIGDLRPQGILAGACMFAGLLVLLIGAFITLGSGGQDFWVVWVVKLLGWVLELFGVWVGVRMLRRAWRMSAFEGPWGRRIT